MKRNFLAIAMTTFALSCFGMWSCSSGDDGGNDMGNNSGSGSGQTSGVVPDNTDNGENNNSQPDNIQPMNPDDSGNTGSGSGGNSGSGDDNGNGGSGSGDNTGSGSGDNSGNGGSGSGDDSGNGGSGSDNNTGSGSGSGSGDSGSSGTAPTWNLVFEDNFDSEGSTPNTEYWSLAPKGDKTWNRYMSESYDQAYQKDGYLYLFGMMSNGEYLTGGIESREKFDFTYGQVKCRARFLRHPQGNHTGIWMMPEPPAQEWPKSGEIDIMEHLDKESIVYETVHFWNEDEQKDDSKDATASINIDEFNVYGVIWDNESISFTVNGQVYFTYKNDNPGSEDFSYQYPFTKPFYLILSQSLGGRGTWEGVIDDSELPAIFQIDWIKVWQKAE